MLRKHIKIEPMLWYHYCDVNGIIVWQDMINGGGNYGLEVSALPFVGINLDDSNYKTFKRTSLEARKLYYKELEEMIAALYNCPCIAMWVPFNEGWDSSTATMPILLSKLWTALELSILLQVGTIGVKPMLFQSIFISLRLKFIRATNRGA